MDADRCDQYPLVVADTAPVSANEIMLGYVPTSIFNYSTTLFQVYAASRVKLPLKAL